MAIRDLVAGRWGGGGGGGGGGRERKGQVILFELLTNATEGLISYQILLGDKKVISF